MYPANLTPHFSTWGKPPELWVNPAEPDKRVLRYFLSFSFITQLKKKAPSSYADPFQTAWAQQPYFNSTGINGRGSLETLAAAGDDDVLEIGSSPSFGKNFIIQYAFEYNAPSTVGTSAYPIHILFSIAPTVASFLPVVNGVTDIMRSRVYQGGTINAINSLAPLTRGAPYVATHIYSHSGNYHEFRLNGVSQGTGAASMVGTPSGVNIYYFNYSAAVPRACDGLMGESAVQFNVPQYEAILTRERYLMNAWGL